MNKWDILLGFTSDKAPRQREYVEVRKSVNSNAEAAEILGIDRRAVDRGIKKLEEKAEAAGFRLLEEEPSILFFDIETRPIVGEVWRLWNDSVIGGPSGIIQDSVSICYAYKWRGHDPVFVRAHDFPTHKEYIESVWSLFDEADWLVAHNGDNFDIKRMNAEMLEQGLKPYSPVKSIDTLKMARRRFKFTSNRLDHLCQKLLGEGKTQASFRLWKDCLRESKEAWGLMEEYNIQDVRLLERLYYRLAAWDTSHPNYMLYSEVDDSSEVRCTVCGSNDVSLSEKTAKTGVRAYPLYQCNSCGHQMRGRSAIPEKHTILTNAR